jgi:superfamily II DNA or RNA helicase
MSSNVYDLEIEDNHNFILPTGLHNNSGPIVHNCHHVSSRTFSQSLFKVSSAKMIGLSATPKRKDGLTKVLKWFLGDMLEKEHLKSRIETPSVEFIKASYENEIKPKYNFKNRVNLPNLINQFVDDPGRNKQIAEKIVEKAKDGRKILMLSDRRGHCIEMKDSLENLLKKEKLKKTVGLYLGSMKEKDLNESNKCDIILATYSMASEGYDNSTLDTLIMSTGKSDIEQSVGRVLRKKNENPPLIIDVTDPEHCYSQMNLRKQYYRKKGFILIGEEKKKSKNEKIEFREE